MSDKLFSNSHLFLVKLSELSLSVMLRLCSNPDPLAELPRFVVYERKTIVQVKQKRKKKILRLSVCKGQKENHPGRSGESVCQTNGQSRWQAAGHRLGEPTGRRKSWEEKLGGEAGRQDGPRLRNAEGLALAGSRERASDQTGGSNQLWTWLPSQGSSSLEEKSQKQNGRTHDSVFSFPRKGCSFHTEGTHDPTADLSRSGTGFYIGFEMKFSHMVCWGTDFQGISASD